MTEFQVWLWFVVLPGIGEALKFVICAVCAIATVFAVGTGAAYITETNTKILPIKTTIALIIIALALPLIRAGIPTEKQVAAIILIPAVTQSERVRGIGDKTLDALSGKLDQWLKDMGGDVQKPEKGEKL